MPDYQYSIEDTNAIYSSKFYTKNPTIRQNNTIRGGGILVKDKRKNVPRMTKILTKLTVFISVMEMSFNK